MKKLAGLALGVSAISILGLAGCADVRPPGLAGTADAMRGTVRGGQQPVSGATIQMFAVGTTSDGVGSGTPLFTVTTDASGTFNAPSSTYTCPTAGSLVYLVATGGSPGLGSGQTNPQLALMAALGPCGSVTNSTIAIINELSTIAAVYALTPYMTSATGVGSTPAHAAALASGFALASQYVNVATGLAPGTNVPTGYVVPIAQINTVADIQATCVNSPGGVASDGSSCGTFFQLTRPSGGLAPTDTISAILKLANNPALNTGPLFNLSTPSAPFQPTDAVQPPDFSISLVLPATMALSPAGGVNFPQTPLGSSSQQTVTLANNGPGPIALTSITLNGANASEFSQTNNCPGTIVAASSCSIFVTSTPLTPGLRDGNIVVATSASNSPASIPLSGNGAFPMMTVSPSVLTFPATTVGTTTAAQTFTVTNSGVGNLPLTGISIGGNSGDFAQTNNCPTTLVPGAFCTVSVTITPTTTGTQAASVIVSTYALQTARVTVSGTGVAPVTVGPLVASTSTLFVAPYLNGTSFLNLTNQGTAPIAISSIAVTGFPATETDSCGASLGAGASCLVSIQSLNTNFNPMNTGSLVITNSSSTPQIAVTLYTSNVTVLNFGSIALGASTSQPISGTGISGVVSGVNAADFGGNGVAYACSSRAGPCSISVPFTPSSVGSRVALFYVGYTLVGFGLAPGVSTGTLSATPGNLSFPQTALNVSSAAQTMTISNPQNHLLNFSSSTVDFVVSPAYCSATSCPVSVIFNPKSAQQYQSSGNVAIFDSATNQTVSFVLDGIGGIPTLTFTPSPLSFGSMTVGQSSVSQTISVSDTGDSPAYLFFTLVGGTGAGDFIGQSNIVTVLAGTPYQSTPYIFRPTALGSRSGVVTVSDSRSGLTLGTYSMTGTGIGPLTVTLSASPASISFPSTVIGVASAPLNVTVTNTGNTTATIGSVSFGGANASDFVNTSSCATVAAQGTCSFTVTFTPGATGLRNGTLVIASNDPASPLTVPLSGTGVPVPTVTLNPMSLTFYERGVAQTVTLMNLAATPLSISAMNIVGNYTQTNNCGTVLAGNSSCSIFVSADQSVGVFTGSITVVDSDTVDAQTVSLSSSVAYTQIYGFSSSIVGVQGATGTHFYGGVVTGTNGQFTYVDYILTLTGPNSSEFLAPFSGAPQCHTHNGQQCGFNLFFTPGGVGARYAVVTGNDGSHSLFKGTGLIPQQTFTFGNSLPTFPTPVSLGSSAQLALAIQNTSTPYPTTLNITSATLSTNLSNNGEFSISNNCGSVGNSPPYCMLTVTFSPQAVGYRSTALTMTSGTGYQMTVMITGIGR